MPSVSLQPFPIPSSPLVASARASPHIAVTAYDAANVAVVDANTGESRTLQLADARIQALALSRDGTQLAVGSDRVSLCNTANGAREWEGATLDRPSALCFVGESALVVACRSSVHVLDLTTKSWRQVFAPPGRRPPEIWILAASTDGRLVAAGTVSVNRKPGLLSVFELATGKVVAALKMRQSACRQLAFSEDGAMLVAADNAGIHLFATGSWKLASPIVPVPATSPIAFTPDGRTAIWDDGGKLSLLELAPKGPVARTVPRDARDTSAFAVAAAEDRVVMFLPDGTGTIWTAEQLASTGETAAATPSHPLAAHPSIAQAALVAGRIVNDARAPSRSGVTRAIYAFATRWRERLGIPVVAIEAPCGRTFDDSLEPYDRDDEATVFPICVGLLVDRVTADSGPHRTRSLSDLGRDLVRAGQLLGELFWRELQELLDGLAVGSFDGYDGDRERWRADNGVALSPALAMHLVALPYDTIAKLAFGVLRARAADALDWIQGQNDRHEPHVRGVVGVLVSATQPDGDYVQALDVTDAAGTAHRERVGELAGRPAYYLVASNVAG